MKAETAARKFSPGVPPWMWFWVVTTPVLTLPSLTVSLVAESVALLDGTAAAEFISGNRIESQWMVLWIHINYFKQGIAGPQLAPWFLILGLLTVLFPQLRSRYLERRNNLAPPPSSIGSLNEIRDFIASHAPGLNLKVNLVRPGRLWVYPNGYRKATLAVFSGFVLLWKTDREAAEAVLLHEIAHYRRGDALFTGPGSFFEIAIKLTLLSNLLDPLLHVVALGTRAVDILADFVVGDINVFFLRRYFLGPFLSSIFLWIYLAVKSPINFFVTVVVVFITPILCIWSAEINADHFVANFPKHKSALLRELSKKSGRLVWWRWVLFRLSHPPESMRRFFLRRSDSYWFVLALLIHPLYIFVLFALSCANSAVALSNKNGIITLGNGGTDWASQFREFFAFKSYGYLGITVVLLIWSFVARRWERFFTRGYEPLAIDAADDAPLPETASPTAIAPNPFRFRYYALAAAFTGTIFVVRLLLWLSWI